MPKLVDMEMIIIAVLAAIVVICLSQIKKLKLLIKEERRKRLSPVLMLETEPSTTSIYLRNDSYCYAKNIHIDDVKLTVDMGFKKHLQLKFEPDKFMLKPDEKAKLTYRVFEDQYDITSADSPNLIHYFACSNMEMRLSYNNIEDTFFTAVIVNDKKNFVLKEVKSI